MENKKFHRAKKSLGQNFLKSLRFVNDLVNVADITHGDVVVEVGSGKGSITKILLKRGAHVIGVEKDDDLYLRLKEKFEDEIKTNKLDLVHGDILKFEPDKHASRNGYKLIGSIPYYITGVFIRTFLTLSLQPELISIIVQKEVAERIVVRDGKESILSISVAVYGKPSYIKTIKAREFSPKPKVDSAILTITDISRDFFTDIDEKNFFVLLRQGFSSKRKKLVGNLSTYSPKDKLIKVFKSLDISPDARAENLHTTDWKKLAQALL